MLRGRATELGRLDELLDAARQGTSGAVVLRGEAGIGKTALLDHVAARAGDARLLRAEGAQADIELPFAALQQLCSPLLGDIARLPTPQHDALGTAFGLRAGPRPDPFLVGLAVLTLLSDAAEAQPLVCLVDDAQWLDRASAHVLAFVARRLDAEGVLMVFAERDADTTGDLAGIEELHVGRLTDADAYALLAAASLGPLDERVRARIIAETRGNPLALLELPRAVSPAGLAGGFAVALQGRIEASFRSRVEELPEETQLLLLVAAAEPLGDPALLWSAAAGLGLRPETAAPAESAELIAIGARVTFRHPLLRSAVYDAAPREHRRAVHGALAEATHPGVDPDRHAWHRAHAALGPDEDVAAELERSANRARARGGLAATAAFFERAAQLTPDPHHRAQRTLEAARRKRLTGQAEAAGTLLAAAEQGPLDELERALALRLHGQLRQDAGPMGDAVPTLLEAARQLEPLDIALARDAYLDAIFTANSAARLGDGTRGPADAARSAPPPVGTPDASDLLLDGLAVLFTEGHEVATPLLQRAVGRALEEDGRDERPLRATRIASRVAAELYDDEAWIALTTRHVEFSREDGVLSVLPATLNYLAAVRICEGDLDAAALLLDESDTISRSATLTLGDAMRVRLAAYRGDEAETRRYCDIIDPVATGRGEGLTLSMCDYATAIVHNGLGEYEAAFAAAQRATAHEELGVTGWALPELVEAAVRCGHADVAREAFERLAARTGPSGTDFARGLEARTRALVSDGAEAEPAYREAIDLLGRTRMRMFAARAELLYGEWLRRAARRSDSRAPLTAAHDLFTSAGADGFAERAARELIATGATPRKRTDEARDQLTAQEAQIASLARQGHTNPEIGAKLYLSPRTVEWHLRKVFMKLEISSRRELGQALA
ncbi:MAG TPA: AAA family ATPase [Gaiellaceae bacterium]|nr:AAA family ATPase [Gaiellaceae bacterium]